MNTNNSAKPRLTFTARRPWRPIRSRLPPDMGDGNSLYSRRVQEGVRWWSDGVAAPPCLRTACLNAGRPVEVVLSLLPPPAARYRSGGAA